MILRTIVVTDFATNCYLVGCPQTLEGAVIDPGGNARAILAAIKEAGLRIKYVLNTHGHFDHIGANEQILQAAGVTLAAHRLEAPMLTNPALNLGAMLGQLAPGPAASLLLEEGDEIKIGRLRLGVLHTPGHTPGGISLYEAAERVVFTGDALFNMGIGRTDFPGGDHALLLKSIQEKLFALPEGTKAYPGHGVATTIGYERSHNPWLY
jgi:glyoxylase-like metal-dependent hydrolase (beta-lactamase superfamily II)